jgi:hypothetical protein
VLGGGQLPSSLPALQEVRHVLSAQAPLAQMPITQLGQAPLVVAWHTWRLPSEVHCTSPTTQAQQAPSTHPAAPQLVPFSQPVQPLASVLQLWMMSPAH